MDVRMNAHAVNCKFICSLDIIWHNISHSQYSWNRRTTSQKKRRSLVVKTCQLLTAPSRRWPCCDIPLSVSWSDRPRRIAAGGLQWQHGAMIGGWDTKKTHWNILKWNMFRNLNKPAIRIETANLPIKHTYICMSVYIYIVRIFPCHCSTSTSTIFQPDLSPIQSRWEVSAPAYGSDGDNGFGPVCLRRMRLAKWVPTATGDGHMASLSHMTSNVGKD